MCDSSYTASNRHQRPHAAAGRPPSSLGNIDDEWASATLSDDEIDVDQRHENLVAPLLEDDDGCDTMLDDVAAIVSTGMHGSDSAADGERRRREEGRWNDLALDQFDHALMPGTAPLSGNSGANGSNSGTGGNTTGGGGGGGGGAGNAGR
mmetsp:Transcript_40290/g.48306  ORF Transcript_40290/g.48306 Transcript_40290/m.48306 type:complete len:150 (-) Transcript_40290:466-915(-)